MKTTVGELRSEMQQINLQRWRDQEDEGTFAAIAGIDPAELLESSRIEFQKEQLRAQFGIPPGYRLTEAATERYQKLMNAPGKAAARRLMQRWALEDKKTPFVTFERDVI